MTAAEDAGITEAEAEVVVNPEADAVARLAEAGRERKVKAGKDLTLISSRPTWKSRSKRWRKRPIRCVITRWARSSRMQSATRWTIKIAAPGGLKPCRKNAS